MIELVISLLLIGLLVVFGFMSGSHMFGSADQAKAENGLRVGLQLTESARFDNEGFYGSDTQDLLEHMSRGVTPGLTIAPMATEDASPNTVLVSRDAPDQVSMCTFANNRWMCMRAVAGKLVRPVSFTAGSFQTLMVAKGTGQGDGTNGHESVAICHATGSSSNPYVLIIVSTEGLNGHGDHPDDLIPAPTEGCPGEPPEATDPNAVPDPASEVPAGAEVVVADDPAEQRAAQEEENLDALGENKTGIVSSYFSSGLTLIDALCNLPTKVEVPICESGTNEF